MIKAYHSIKDHLNIYGPGLLIILLGFVLAYQFVKPAPPESIRMATGQQSGAYYLFAQRYQGQLKEERIDLQLLNTAGSIDNIRLLTMGEADVAFVQGGSAGSEPHPQLRSLGSLYFEPIWLFYRGSLQVEKLTDLIGREIAIGAEGSGTRTLAQQLLGDNAVTTGNSVHLPLGGREAADALLEGRIDAAFFVASPKSPVVRALLDAESIRLMDFKRADAYTRIHRYLTSVVLPQGVVNLNRDLPPRETVLLAASANLVVNRDLHPALIGLLLQSARSVHGNGGWFEQAGEFPAPSYLDFPLSKEARRYYDYGPPFLQRYLPFWAATLIDRLKVMLLPLIALMLPLIKIMPPIYRWRIRSRIYRWYREVLAIDREQHREGHDPQQALDKLDQIEMEVCKVSVPLSYAEELYDLRLHIELVREKLRKGDAGP